MYTTETYIQSARHNVTDKTIKSHSEFIHHNKHGWVVSRTQLEICVSANPREVCASSGRSVSGVDGRLQQEITLCIVFIFNRDLFFIVRFVQLWLELQFSVWTSRGLCVYWLLLLLPL